MSVRDFGIQGNLSVFLFFFTGIIGSVLLLCICRIMSRQFFMKGIELIGENTLPIMAFHLILLNFMCTKLLEFPCQSVLIQKGICLILSLIICYVIIIFQKTINFLKKYIKEFLVFLADK